MHNKAIKEALTFWGPSNASEVKKKLELRDIDLDVGYVSAMLARMAERKEIFLANVIDKSGGPYYKAF